MTAADFRAKAPPYPPDKSPPKGRLGTQFALAHPVPTLSIRRQRTGESRLRHRRTPALRHRRRWDRHRRCRCTHRRTPLARRWRGWRLRSADQSSNSCVQSSAETMWTQEKKAEKRKKTLQKSLDNVRSAWYHRATPPRGGRGGSTYGAKVGWHDTCCALFSYPCL